MQPAGADVLDRGVDRDGDVGQRVDGVIGETERQTLGAHERDHLLDQARLGLGEDAAEVGAGQRFQFDADRQPALQLGQQVRRLGEMERT